MSSNLRVFLSQTLIPQSSRQAEQELRKAANVPTFVQSLLGIICDHDTDLAVRQAGALFFKNYIKRCWTEDDSSSGLSSETKQFIKSGIVQAMTSLPTTLQLQVGEAVTVIANSDFPAQWPTLIDDLIANANPNDMVVTNGVLQTAHSIFKRWRSQYRSDELFTEIAFVLSKFCDPLLAIFKQTDSFIDQNAENPAALNVLLETMVLLTKVFYDLNSQDIPEFFEDHMAEFMSILLKYLAYSNPILEANADEDLAGPLERTKASICEIAQLYTQRYEEVFSMLPDFVSSVWNLLTQVSLASRYDQLVGRALAFLTCVVKIQRHAVLFESEEVLQQFVEKIILPNMSLRPSDEELFEDDPIHYIRRDLDGGENDSRRHSATEFVRGLVEQFEQRMTTIVLRFVSHYLQQYHNDPAQNWASKDTAMYLITAITIKGVITKNGVSSTNLMIDVVKIFDENALPDLQAPFENCHPILKLDAIKFVFTFRNQLTKQQLSNIFPLLANHLAHKSYVVSTYSAVTIDALLSLKRDGAIVFNKQEVATVAAVLLDNIYKLIERGATPETIAENDFLMRCIMRIIVAAQETIVAQTSNILSHQNRILAEISKNPSNPQFSHYLFETYGAIIRYLASVSPGNLTQVEEMALEPLLQVLQKDVTEFVPYIFQLIAQLLELHNEDALSPTYEKLLQPIMTPALWDSRGNIPALVRLLQAFLQQNPNTFLTNNYLEPVLGIFQKLIASKMNDTYGLDLIESLYRYMPSNSLTNYNRQVFILLLTRLNNSNTEKFTLRFVVFVFYLSALQPNVGPDLLITIFEDVQAGLFTQVFNGVVLPNTQKIILPIEAKTTSIGLTNFLTRSEKISTDFFSVLWLPILMCQLKFMELPANERKDEDLLSGLEIEDAGFQAAYVKLRTAARVASEPWIAIENPRHYFVEELNKAILRDSRLTAAISAMPEDAKQVLKSYGVTI